MALREEIIATIEVIRSLDNCGFSKQELIEIAKLGVLMEIDTHLQHIDQTLLEYAIGNLPATDDKAVNPDEVA